MLLVLAAPAVAQQYDSEPVDQDVGRKLSVLAKECVRNPARFAADRAQFAEYFQKYYFPAMTRPSPDALGQLGKMRDDLFSRFLWASSDENLQRELTQMASKFAWPVVLSKGKHYHPAVRYNAILVLGLLDEQYAIDRRGANRRPPVPLKDATAKLTQIVDYAAEGNRTPPFLVVGALVGLQRHALYDDKLDRATVEAMSAAALKLATKDVPLPEIDPKVADWVRLQAATVLTNLGKPGANGEVQAALTKIIAGETVPKMTLDGRCQAAAQLADMKFDEAKVDGKPLFDALLQLVVAVADDEAKEAEKFRDMQYQGGGYGGGYGAAPVSKGRLRLDPETGQWTYDDRILLTRLHDLQTAFNGASTIVPADKQPVIDAVKKAMEPAIAAAESADAVDLAVAAAVVTMQGEIQTAVNGGAAPTSEPEPQF